MSSIASRWRARLATRKALLAAARKRHEWHPTAKSRELIVLRKAQVAYAERVLARHSRVRVDRPFTPRADGYGPLGDLTDVTVHHDAAVIGPRAGDALVKQRLKTYDQMHRNLWGGGIGYHEAIAPDGKVWQLRLPSSKGAHTARHNSNNYGVMLLGNFEVHSPTEEQLRSLERRFTEPPPRGLPDLRWKRVRGHQDWPDNATACPGRELAPHVRRLPRYVG